MSKRVAHRSAWCVVDKRTRRTVALFPGAKVAKDTAEEWLARKRRSGTIVPRHYTVVEIGALVLPKGDEQP